ncbi:MAG TPA: glutamate formimidoyltransferase [Candidatus Thermoplasmatota archaeon]|nr:glutamate formimidoyltransferase [Candidatus Thermoplasmatota archaeon]
MKLVACVANFSEGRDPDVLSAIERAAASVPGVLVLDVHVDADHHRSVMSFVGADAAVAEAAFRAAKEAAARIDLTKHRGVHPRMGAVDVLPFVPVGVTPLEDCIRVARATGERIGRELGIPVFLYEGAASRPERKTLSDVRRGEFEGLAKRFEEGETPDFGPARAHPTAGAVAVGARMPLVAFNVDLDTDDLQVAKEIARSVRESGGGLRAVRALGVALADRGIVQVTMNLVDYRETPPHVAYREVVKEAEKRGVRVLGSEIVGLLPIEALLPAMEEALGLPVTGDRILEISLMRQWIEGGGPA